MCCGHQSSITETVVNGIVGLTKVALRIDIADNKTIEERRTICRQCEYATRNNNPKFDKFNGLTNFSRCTKCQCNIKAKTQGKASACPIKKWMNV